MKTYHHSTIQRHILEGGDYDEHDDGYVTLHRQLVPQAVRLEEEPAVEMDLGPDRGDCYICGKMATIGHRNPMCRRCAEEFL